MRKQIEEKAKEFIKGCEHDGSFIPVDEVLRLMVDFHFFLEKDEADKSKIILEISTWNTLAKGLTYPHQQAIKNDILGKVDNLKQALKEK